MRDYYNIASSTLDGLSGLFVVRLNTGSKVYEGHFPGSPVSPGVCNILMILECAEKIVQQPIRVQKISRCRFTTLISPLTHPELEIHIELQSKENSLYTLNASIGKGEETYLTIKADIVSDSE